MLGSMRERRHGAIMASVQMLAPTGGGVEFAAGKRGIEGGLFGADSGDLTKERAGCRDDRLH